MTAPNHARRAQRPAPLRDRLDKQMTKFHQTHPEIYARYQSARAVVDPRGGVGTEPLTRHAIAT